MSYFTEIDHLDNIMHDISARLQLKFCPWPPDGVLLHILMFALIVSVQSFVSAQVLLFALFLKIKDIITNMSLLPDALTKVTLMFLNHFLNMEFKNDVVSIPCIQRKIFATVVASHDDNNDQMTNESWDSDSIQVVLDNSATTHIWNELTHFDEGSIKYFDDNNDVGVLTIGEVLQNHLEWVLFMSR